MLRLPPSHVLPRTRPRQIPNKKNKLNATLEKHITHQRKLTMKHKALEFYTLPPIPYPFILINARNPQINYVLQFKPVVQKIILDSGIEIFRNPNIKDYPPNHLEKIVILYRKLRRLFPKAEIRATVPDYCDDYHPKNLWLSEEVTNIERTVQNIIHATETYPDINWLIPIQGWNHQPSSIERCIKQLNDYDLNNYNYYAIGNLCVYFNAKIIHETAKIARKLLPEKKLHIFGLKLKAIPLVYPFIDSFDSMAWTRPVDSSLSANWSCKTTRERIQFFKAWLNRLNYYLSQSYLL
jgi:hypothetical protein